MIAEHGLQAAGQPALNVSDVYFNFNKQGRRTFSKLSFAVPQRQFVAVVGPSGCGKSTLLRLMAGLLRPARGTVAVAGQPITGPSPSIGIMFQSDTLLPWRTAIRNVRLGLEGHLDNKEALARSLRMLELVGLSESSNKYPHQLSGGMRQRVNLARALVIEPEVLLMDEPFGALDAQTREAQQEHLLKIWEADHKTIIFVTHDIEEAVFLADRVIVLGRAGVGIVADLDLDIERPRDLTVKSGLAYRNAVKTIHDIISAQRA